MKQTKLPAYCSEAKAIEIHVRGSANASREDLRELMTSQIFRIRYRDRAGKERFMCVTAADPEAAMEKCRRISSIREVLGVSLNKYTKTSCFQ